MSAPHPYLAEQGFDRLHEPVKADSPFPSEPVGYSGLVLTMDPYTHTLIGDERAALDRLPAIEAPRASVAALAATGT